MLYKISKLQETDVEVGPSIDIYYNYRKYLIFLRLFYQNNMCSVAL